MTDYTELKRLAEAFPADLDWDSNSEPFFNGPSGESLGGGPTGFYCVYGPAFEIDDEQYDGPTYVESCKVDFAKFMVAARDGVLALIAENERLERKNANQSESIREYQDLVMGGDVSLGMLKADIRVTTGERDQLRAEVAGLKTGYEAYERVNAELKAEVDGLRKSLLDAAEEIDAWGSYASDYFQEKHDLAGCVAKFHAAAMGKGEQS